MSGKANNAAVAAENFRMETLRVSPSRGDKDKIQSGHTNYTATTAAPVEWVSCIFERWIEGNVNFTCNFPTFSSCPFNPTKRKKENPQAISKMYKEAGRYRDTRKQT